MINCVKCHSPSIVPMEYPLDTKGLKCIMCGKDMWYDMIDKEGMFINYESIGLPKPIRKNMIR